MPIQSSLYSRNSPLCIVQTRVAHLYIRRIQLIPILILLLLRIDHLLIEIPVHSQMNAQHYHPSIHCIKTHLETSNRSDIRAFYTSTPSNSCQSSHGQSPRLASYQRETLAETQNNPVLELGFKLSTALLKCRNRPFFSQTCRNARYVSLLVLFITSRLRLFTTRPAISCYGIVFREGVYEWRNRF